MLAGGPIIHRSELSLKSEAKKPLGEPTNVWFNFFCLRLQSPQAFSLNICSRDYGSVSETADFSLISPFPVSKSGDSNFETPLLYIVTFEDSIRSHVLPAIPEPNNDHDGTIQDRGTLVSGTRTACF